MTARIIAPYLAYIRVDVRLFLRSKPGVFWTFAFPILLLASYVFLFSRSSLGTVEVRVQDLDGGVHSASLVQRIEDGFGRQDTIDVRFLRTGDAGVVQGRGLGLVIPAGFSAAADAGRPTMITVSMGDAAEPAVKASAGLLQGAIAAWNRDMAGVVDRAVPQLVMPEAGGVNARIDYLVTGLIVMIALSSAFMGFSVPLVVAREAGLTRQLSLWPLNHAGLLLAWAMSKMLVVFVSAGVLVTIATVFLGFGVGVRPAGLVAAVLVMMCGVGALLAIALLIASRSRSAQTTVIISNLIYFAGLFAGNLIIPLADLPGPARFLLSVSPINGFVGALREAMATPDLAAVLNSSVPGSVLMLIAIGALAFFIGVRRFVWSQSVH